ncbi:YSIRK-type signal peptide-containing protein [Streptococcus agalactiae]|uniref:LPXTG cell wall anchor domain-containing protein n=1 Tax=Streptococcus agalactiae TaxID=1311 RepID=UPI000F5ECA01|nr:LPXTG cell wall anchor domain-containing protein [Streptococcus agalactiae]MCC9673782.1 YSIRK-type signal peptide-containing protein [Streptococcus agalactiae]RRA64124.1 YSIRK-type signal peptide-containing protein [Streptococcus agalactiae]RRA98384.1 YSIRK-type signal peptide-containing protein [Streptococcus agalactiae]HEO7870676.1 YSIRK-type signal peptide-containing protein [Streptococcus agalactiae]HEO7883220.1 YSIRK-type signal peptide-containing protein [Streptococcus agalactiae]
MNNNEKKVKYFLRKTAYGLASMSAAFIVCSGIVHADTSSGISDSIPHKKQVNLGAVTLKNLISKYRGNDKAIAILLNRVDDFNRASQDTLPQLINSTEAEINNTLPQGRIIKQSIPVVRLKVERLGSGAIKAESINNIKAESINKIQGKSTNTIKAESINKIKVALSKKAKEIYEKHKSILPTPGYYADSVGTYLNRFRDKRTFGNRSVWTGQSGLDEAKKMLDEVKKLLKELQDLTRGTKEDKKPDVKPEAKPEAKPNIQVPKQAPTEAAKPVLSPEALTRLTTWYNQAKDLLKDDQVKDKYVDILAVQKAVDQAYDHVEEGKFITTDQANQLANKLRDALQSLELKDKKVAKPEAKPATKKSVNTSGNLAAKKAIENKKYSKKLPSTGEAASPLLAIVSLIVMLSAGLITIVLKHKKN